MNFVNKSDLLWNSNNGCDHSYMAYHIVKYLSCAGYSDIYRAFPEGLPPAADWHTMNVHAADLILCILYKDAYDTEPFEVLNIAMSAPISKTVFHQPDLNENVPARQKKQFFMD